MPPLTWPKIWQEYRLPIILGSVSLLLVAASLTLLLKSFQMASPIEFSSDASASGQINQTITIDIEGAVEKPGVYQLPLGSRVEEAIAAAGGLSSEADGERIAKVVNRASRLSDGAKLYFPKKGDSVLGSKSQAQPQGLSLSGESASLVSVNTASQSELEALPGIGPVTARKIIDNRPYGSLEELVAKKALSQSLFNKLKEQLTL